ncbi:hypothetical protein MRX96_003449 [Rhipicephalus microplus]
MPSVEMPAIIEQRRRHVTFSEGRGRQARSVVRPAPSFPSGGADSEQSGTQSLFNLLSESPCSAQAMAGRIPPRGAPLHHR